MDAAAVGNTLRFVLASPSRIGTLAKKIGRRFTGPRGSLSPRENLDWLASHCQDFPRLAREIDEPLWKEAESVGAQIEAKAQTVLAATGVGLGGGGYYTMLYFIARHTRPDCVVETGVAAGFTSQAFLAALERNEKGFLYSSDFPYFRLPDPEKYIGILVDEPLKKRWELYTEGDEKNLPAILGKVGKVDLFHYDSDKTYAGRLCAMRALEPRLSEHAVIVMDDIQDNCFFHDYVHSRPQSPWSVFHFQNKYLGLIGDLTGKGSRALRGT